MKKCNFILKSKGKLKHFKGKNNNLRGQKMKKET